MSQNSLPSVFGGCDGICGEPSRLLCFFIFSRRFSGVGVPVYPSIRLGPVCGGACFLPSQKFSSLFFSPKVRAVIASPSSTWHPLSIAQETAAVLNRAILKCSVETQRRGSLLYPDFVRLTVRCGRGRNGAARLSRHAN